MSAGEFAENGKQHVPLQTPSYSEDDVFTAGWVRTAGGAIFFNKAKGRTLLSDEKLPRGWAFSKTSLIEGGRKMYENLITGECRSEPPFSVTR